MSFHFLTSLREDKLKKYKTAGKSYYYEKQIKGFYYGMLIFRKVSGNPRLFNCRDESVIHVRIRTLLFLNCAYLHS